MKERKISQQPTQSRGFNLKQQTKGTFEQSQSIDKPEFYNVKIPTHENLDEVAEIEGLKLNESS